MARKATALTVALQDYSCGESRVGYIEFAYLQELAKDATPTCFWTGDELTFGTKDSPETAFSCDRLVFEGGRALSYAHPKQVTVAASYFANSVFLDMPLAKRIAYLDQLDDEKIWRAAEAHAKSVWRKIQSINHAQERRQPIEPSMKTKFRQFKQNAKHPVEWKAYEWRYFRAISGGRGAHIDRVFNSDSYSLTNCMYIEAGLNFAKRNMKEFRSSVSFDGVSKLLYGARRVRNKLKAFVEKTRPNRKLYHRLVKEKRENPMMWQEMYHNLEEEDSDEEDSDEEDSDEEDSDEEDSDEEDSDEMSSLIDEGESAENEEQLETDQEDFEDDDDNYMDIDD
ncbi:hypothetical protein BKA57DRAFT_514186 [Linnemannia elongata]|nr:hypothetical protein BKA57DRAFT_514186 [Linnemannia elongata]